MLQTIVFGFMLPRLLSDLKWRAENLWSWWSVCSTIWEWFAVPGSVQLVRTYFPALQDGYTHLFRVLIGLLGLSTSFMIDHRDAITLVLQRTIEFRSKFLPFVAREQQQQQQQQSFIRLQVSNR